MRKIQRASTATDTNCTSFFPRTYAESGDLDILGPVLAQDAMFIPRVQQGKEMIGFKGAVYSDQEVRIRKF
jgi:hypothetical protein